MKHIKCAHDEIVALRKLKPHPDNPNKHSPEQIETLADIIEYQGQRRAVKVSKRSGFITAGHCLKKAAAKKGWKELAVDYQDYKDEEQEYADLVADNDIARWAITNLGMVKDKLKNLGKLDVRMLGIKDFGDTEEKKGKTEDDDTPVKPKKPKSKLGDLYLLGDHRVLCGDCTVKENIDQLMDGAKADMVFTDPPYNLASHSKMKQGLIDVRGDSYGKLVKSEWDKNFDPKRMFPSIEAVLNGRASVYICTSHFLFGEIQKWAADTFDFNGYCVWAKSNPTPSLSKKHWAFCTELILYATQSKHPFNYPTEGNALSCWQLPKIVKSEFHPTQKPIAVPEHAISHSSKPGMLIWDGFLGSGSTLIACEKTSRKCYGMEIDPGYVDVIVKRWQDFTGKKAELIRNGKTKTKKHVAKRSVGKPKGKA